MSQIQREDNDNENKENRRIPPQTERKSQENKKWQVQGKCELANTEQTCLHAATTPSAVFTVTTIATMSSTDAVTTKNAGI
jgi:hypothetical protein